MRNIIFLSFIFFDLFKIYLMTITKLISYVITVAMIGVIIWAQNQVSLFDSPIPDLPWSIVSLVDLYSGFILICVWIIYKEPLPTAIIWSFLF